MYFKRSFRENPRNLLRRCGYHETYNTKTKVISFARRVGRLTYPQFHIFINKETGKEVVLNLHLDAKKPSYPGFHAHSGEYDTEVVKKEAVRIKRIFGGF
jgi:hypothetical protein